MLGDTWLGHRDDSVSEESSIVTLGAGDMKNTAQTADHSCTISY